jgi:hypothetical protein
VLTSKFKVRNLTATSGEYMENIVAVRTYIINHYGEKRIEYLVFDSEGLNKQIIVMPDIRKEVGPRLRREYRRRISDLQTNLVTAYQNLAVLFFIYFSDNCFVTFYELYRIRSVGFMVRFVFVKTLRYFTTMVTKLVTSNKMHELSQQPTTEYRIRKYKIAYQWDVMGNFYILDLISSHPDSMAIRIFVRKRNFAITEVRLFEGIVATSAIGGGIVLLGHSALAMPVRFSRDRYRLMLTKRKCGNAMNMSLYALVRFAQTGSENYPLVTNDGTFISWPTQKTSTLVMAKIYSPIPP